MRSRLAGARAEREGDLVPGVEIRRGGRQVQDDPADGDDHVHAEFEQPLAEPGHLTIRTIPSTTRAKTPLIVLQAYFQLPTVLPSSNLAPTKPPAGEPSRIGRIRIVTFDPGLNVDGRMPLRPS